MELQTLKNSNFHLLIFFKNGIFVIMAVYKPLLYGEKI
jgi:hypothetical protein